MTEPLINDFLTINGQRLEIARYHPKAKPKTTLVFLHEGLGSTSLWRDFPVKLAEATGCRAFVFSRFGYGQSEPCPLPRPIRFMHDEGLTVLPKVLKAARIDDYILIGHSDGGSIALIHAGGSPAKGLRGVITEAAHVFCEELTIQSIKKAKTAFLSGNLRKQLEKYHGANTDTAFWGWNDVWLHPDFIKWNIERYLPKIRVPVLAIQGEDDNYGTQAQIERIANQAGAGAETVIISACSHSPHRDQITETLRVMIHFIRRLTTIGEADDLTGGHGLVKKFRFARPKK
jgi:pimeloyl-ACP methyl ester carboxylesterase